MSLFEANSRAIKRVEQLKVEVAKKLEGRGKASFPTQRTYRDIGHTGGYSDTLGFTVGPDYRRPRLTFLLQPSDREPNRWILILKTDSSCIKIELRESDPRGSIIIAIIGGTL